MLFSSLLIMLRLSSYLQPSWSFPIFTHPALKMITSSDHSVPLHSDSFLQSHYAFGLRLPEFPAGVV
jgi:hypothetical protein